MKQLKIVNCRDPLMWYRNQIGSIVPYLGESDDIRGPIYWSREPAGYKNIVFKTDAELIELHDDGPKVTN